MRRERARRVSPLTGAIDARGRAVRATSERDASRVPLGASIACAPDAVQATRYEYTALLTVSSTTSSAGPGRASMRTNSAATERGIRRCWFPGTGGAAEASMMSSGDAAGHPYRGMTPRNRSLFLERGHAYVDLVYGSTYMLNVSSEIAGIGAGVLIRALEPRDGIPIMQRNRQIERLRDLARGPGRLAAALRVDSRFDGLDLCREGPLWLGRCDHEPGEIGQSIGIGIARDANRLLRS
jgi:DNA-3-methyladenine glycosylase